MVGWWSYLMKEGRFTDCKRPQNIYWWMNESNNYRKLEIMFDDKALRKCAHAHTTKCLSVAKEQVLKTRGSTMWSKGHLRSSERFCLASAHNSRTEQLCPSSTGSWWRLTLWDSYRQIKPSWKCNSTTESIDSFINLLFIFNTPKVY